MKQALGKNINVDFNPSAFEYAWSAASDKERDKYIILSAKIPVNTWEEKWFLLWLCGQDQMIVDGFLSLMNRSDNDLAKLANIGQAVIELVDSVRR